MLKALGAMIASAASAGAAAVGSAIGGLTLGGLATGASIVGTGMQLVGMATGSKTLSKIGMGMSLAGGIGQGFNAVRGSLTSGLGGSAVRSSSALLGNSGVDDVLSSNVKGALSSEDIINNSPLKGSGSSSLTSASNFNKASDAIGSGADSIATGSTSYSPGTKEILQKIDNTLTRYSMPMNIIGGMGEAYMMKQQLDQRDRMQQRDIQFAQNAVDRRSQMPGQFQVAPAVQFNPNAYTPLLRN